VTHFLTLFPKSDDRKAESSTMGGEVSQGANGVPDLGTVRVEDVNIQKECRLVVHTDPRSPGADRFRYLRIRLREPWEAGKLKSVLITSALPKDGKSTVAINLASALSEHGKKRVLLIEADLHRPTLASLLGLKAGPGLVECLGADVNPLPFVRRLQPLGWYLMTAGGKCPNPTEILQSGALPDLLSRLSPHFDWILIDSPPVIPITDALSVARDVDAILMVVRAGSTPRDLVQRALALLGRKKLVAVVLNGLEGLNKMYSRYGYYDDYSSNGGENTQGKVLDAPTAKAKSLGGRP
jgi:capsular exopolysaccharide synthesis family protein